MVTIAVMIDFRLTRFRPSMKPMPACPILRVLCEGWDTTSAPLEASPIA
jgi:hypothetical protein